MGMDAKHTPATCHYRRIGFVSTSRADAGIYESMIHAFRDDMRHEPILFAGGTHHAETFGRTIDTLPALQRLRVIPVHHHVAGDRPVDVAASVGRAVDAFSRAFVEERPDLLFVLGDRAEMLAAALSATIHRIPIAHLHGGEATAGAYDDACRHAIAKLSHIHFASLPEYAARLATMNEDARRIHMVGAPALDRLRSFQPMNVDELSTAVGLDFERDTIVVIFHPETLATITPESQTAALLGGLADTQANLLFIGANADVGHAAVTRAIREFAGRRLNARWNPSLPRDVFWSALARARALVGNSSAGIIEAASFRLPVVNIGDRQTGRIRAINVIDVPFDASAIERAIERAQSPEFASSLNDLTNPYGDGRAAQRVHDIVQTLPAPAELLLKFL